MMKITDTTVSSPLNQKAVKTGEGQRLKSTLSYDYDFNVHCYIGHLCSQPANGSGGDNKFWDQDKDKGEDL